MQQLIFDIGFFKGEDTEFYLKKGYNVVAVDANPLLVEAGKKKFAEYISTGQLTLLNIGMSHSKGILPFYVNGKNLQWSAFDLQIGSRNNTPYKVVEVPTNSVQWLIEQYGMPYYIKIDIEGYDKYVIQGLGKDIPQFISCEATEMSLIDDLYQLGYRKFKIIHQGDNFRQISLKRESSQLQPLMYFYYNGLKKHLGKRFKFKYSYGSSGPFGEETDGSWQTYEEVKETYRAFTEGKNGQAINPYSWFDFHASK